MRRFEVTPGDSAIILGQPHGGTDVPDEIFRRLNMRGQELADTDWHIDRLYAGLLPGATIVRSHIHRYVIDANRDPGGVTLYPGQNTTGLCPTTDFDGRPIWRAGQEPSQDEIMARRELYHAPYHAALAEQIDRVKARHGFAIVYDCHSIRSHIPFLFDGTLPVFNIGTNDAKTCDPLIEKITAEICALAPAYDYVLNGRFKGGWTTRHYASPESGVHTIQMEVSQRAYMNEAMPRDYLPGRAKSVRPVLAAILENLDELARSGKLAPQRRPHGRP